MAGLISNILRQAPKVIRHGVAFNTQLRPSLVKQSFVRNCHCTATMQQALLKVQHPAPDFRGIAVIGEEFKEIQLSDFKGKYVVLVFYPLDFTFVCPTELIAFSERIDDFEKLEAQVVGISIDSHFSHLAWTNTKREEGGLGKIKYPLLSDIHKTIARDYGVLIEKEGIALRGQFIIDPKGVLRQVTVNDLPIGRSVDEALRIIEAIRFVEEHGEVCPANWHKGDKTIKPDPKGSKEYFKSVNKK